MNDLVLSRLPRFDLLTEQGDGSVLSAEAQQESVPPELLDGAVGDALDGDEIGSPEVTEMLPALMDTQRENIERCLQSLSDSVLAVENGMREQVTLAIQDIAAQLFPKLSELVLADELARHIPEITPSSEPSVVIKVPPQLADTLAKALAQLADKPSNCTIVADDSALEGHVEVCWPSGGQEYDFSTLLASCLEGIQSAYGNIEG